MSPESHEILTPQEMMQDDLLFAMEANGFFPSSTAEWKPNHQEAVKRNLGAFGYMFQSFPYNESHFKKDPEGKLVANTFIQKPVIDAVRRYRGLDEEEARRISFLLGFTARSLWSDNSAFLENIREVVAFTASMTKLGQRKSGEAIVAAMAMHILGGGSLKEDNLFKGNVYHMAEAIAQDPTALHETEDLGISQAVRLLKFIRKTQGRTTNNLEEDVKSALVLCRHVFVDFPTVGAEFHIPETPDLNESFWQRVALLNMVQYQTGSYIPFSRKDGGLIEIRMNPSVYPVAVATWNLMRLILPEINQSYFTITINQNNQNKTNFEKDHNKDLIKGLYGIGNLSYAAHFQSIPPVKTPQQVNFGDWYLGQTVRVKNGKFIITGLWADGHGRNGQLNICTGFGKLFPHLALRLSMALKYPRIIDSRVLRASTLVDSLRMADQEIRDIFESLNASIMNDLDLSKIVDNGEIIIKAMRP